MGAPPELLESITNLDLEVQKAFEGSSDERDAALLGEESPLTPEACGASILESRDIRPFPVPFLRMVRILRILKAGKVNVMLENLVFLGPGAAFFRVQRLPVLEKKAVGSFMVGKMLMAIGLVTHILTCLWFWLGKLVHEEGIRKSWLDLANVTELDLGLQYAHSASWILLPPSPPTLEPDSRVERLASLMCFAAWTETGDGGERTRATGA
eukprot:g25478.t1